MAGIAVARTETTLAQWDACWRDLGCRSYIDDHGRGRGDRPAGGITWQDAQDYIAWLNRRSAEDVSSACDRYRLPTSAEWEKAARATATTPLPWGSSVLPGRAHCRDCGSPFAADAAAPAASFPPNDFGLHDMIGNLWEWTEDPDNPCRAEAGYAGCAPGLAKGGGFSTAASHLSIMLGGPMLRGPARGPMGYRYPSLGLRVVCEMKRKN
jgi:formylglycine-generating enzyme required for sulfatase activity